MISRDINNKCTFFLNEYFFVVAVLAVSEELLVGDNNNGGRRSSSRISFSSTPYSALRRSQLSPRRHHCCHDDNGRVFSVTTFTKLKILEIHSRSCGIGGRRNGGCRRKRSFWRKVESSTTILFLDSCSFGVPSRAFSTENDRRPANDVVAFKQKRFESIFFVFEYFL